MNKKLIVALDFDSAELALNFLENLDPQKCLVKVGLELFISEGWKVLDLISEKGFEIFLDLKLHDIPNTVANSVRKISNFNVALTTIHLNGGKDMIEAAKLDGASDLKIFTAIIIPYLEKTILVIWTIITILVLKIFDIILAMTNGQWNTEVLANLMFDWMFRGGGDSGRGSLMAIVIMLGVIPIMIWNIRRQKMEEKI